MLGQARDGGLFERLVASQSSSMWREYQLRLMLPAVDRSGATAMRIHRTEHVRLP